MFDTHCHLTSKEFDDSLTKVVNDARDNGVKYFVIPSLNLDDSVKILKTVENYQNVYGALGIHPTENLDKIDLDRILFKLEEMILSNFKIVAIGEIGLDYYRYESGIDTQKKFFIRQLTLAIKLDKSIIIHQRHSSTDVIKILKSIGESSFAERTVFHCCPADKKVLDFAVKNKIFIGVDGDVTYDKEKEAFLKMIPDNLIVVETDSPYLTPNPIRKTNKFPNLPSNLKYTLSHIAKMRNTSLENMCQITTNNAVKLFNLTKLL